MREYSLSIALSVCVCCLDLQSFFLLIYISRWSTPSVRHDLTDVRQGCRQLTLLCTCFGRAAVNTCVHVRLSTFWKVLRRLCSVSSQCSFWFQFFLYHYFFKCLAHLMCSRTRYVGISSTFSNIDCFCFVCLTECGHTIRTRYLSVPKYRHLLV